MEKKDILKAVNEIFKEVLENDSIVLHNDTSSKDIEEWDSLAQIQLVVAIENFFKIKFKSMEILTWACVGDMIDCIYLRLK